MFELSSYFIFFILLSSKQQILANYNIAVLDELHLSLCSAVFVLNRAEGRVRQPRQQLGTASCGGWATRLHPLLPNWFPKRGLINTYHKWYKQPAPTCRDIMYHSQQEMKQWRFDQIESGLATHKAEKDSHSRNKYFPELCTHWKPSYKRSHLIWWHTHRCRAFK